jgi:hypothetical protein
MLNLIIISTNPLNRDLHSLFNILNIFLFIWNILNSPTWGNRHQLLNLTLLNHRNFLRFRKLFIYLLISDDLSILLLCNNPSILIRIAYVCLIHICNHRFILNRCSYILWQSFLQYGLCLCNWSTIDVGVCINFGGIHDRWLLFILIYNLNWWFGDLLVFDKSDNLIVENGYVE